jgi:hypothetical protein
MATGTICGIVCKWRSQRQGYMGRGIYYVTEKETIASIKQISPTHSLFPHDLVFRQQKICSFSTIQKVSMATYDQVCEEINRQEITSPT